MLRLEQFNGFATHIDSTILMLNDIWNSLVNNVEATKKRYEELEAAMTTMNDRLNNKISTLDARVDRCKDKHRTLHNVMEDVQATVNKQQCLMYDMDKGISYYSSAIVQLEGKKAEEVKNCFNALEQRIAGQDDQIKIPLHHLAAAEEGRCRCRESTPKVISWCCFDLIRNQQKMCRRPRLNWRPEGWNMRTKRWRPSAAP